MNRTLTIISITILAIGLGLHLNYLHKASKMADPNNLEEPLKSFYLKLQEKGYKPTTNPLSERNSSVTFYLDQGKDKIKVTVNSLNLVLIENNNKSYSPIKYSKEGFTINKRVLSENTDLFEGVLEIIENMNYKI